MLGKLPVIYEHLFIYSGLDSRSDQASRCETVFQEEYQNTSDKS